MSVVAAACLAGLAAACALLREGSPGRLDGLLAGPARPRAAPPDRFPLLAGLGAGLVATLLVSGLPGLLLGAAAACLAPSAVRRLRAPAWQDEDLLAARDLPLALDLLAACLAGGASLSEGVTAVGVAVPGPCGLRLVQVATGLAVGAAPDQAWRPLAGGPDGGPPLPGPAAAAARALARAGEGGAPVATSVSRIAATARAEAAAVAAHAARRAGVLAVGPLGLCFLPAFVLLGVVPTVAGLTAPLLAGL